MARQVVTRASIRKAGGFSVEGLDAFYDKLDAVLDQTRAENLKDTFMKAAVVIRDQAKQNAPVRTGLLRSAIFAAPGTLDKPNALVGISRSARKTGAKPAPHGLLIEYGTSKMPAQPFFRPAVTTKRAEAATIIVDGIESVIEGTWK